MSILVLSMFACLALRSYAQDPPSVSSGGMMPPENLPRVVGPGVLPDLMYMRNQKGEEILVPRARYEDFERLLMETELGGEGLAATPSLNQLDLTIEPMTDYAKVQVRGLISLKKANRTTWTVPIALSQLQWVPRDKASADPSPVGNEVQGPVDGVESIATSAQSNGYLWRLGPGKNLSRRIELEAVCKLLTNSNGNSIRLDLPPAATVIKLRLPKGDWELNANGGGNEVIEPFQNQGEYSVATVRTSSNSLNLNWSRKVNREAIAAIEARSQTKFSPSGDSNRWRASTSLSIRGPIKLGGKRILWTLPTGGLLREANSNVISFSSYRLVKDQPAEGATTDPVSLSQKVPTEAWWIEVDDAYARSDLEASLEWELSQASMDSKILFESPKLDGIERHNGTIEFAIPRTKSIEWTTSGNVQLVRQSQAADGSESIVYTYQFNGQPATIDTQWTSVADRPRITSDHRIEIRENRILLRGAIEFGSDPIQLPLLQLEALGWKPERIVLYPSEIDLPLDSIVQANSTSEKDKDAGWSLPISANLWIRSNTASRPTSSESVRSDRLVDAGLGGIGTGKSFEALPNSPDKKESNQAWRMEYLLSRITQDGTNEIDFSLPRLSWLSQESQQRVETSVPGRVFLFSWPYRLSTQPNSGSGLIETSLDRTLLKQVLGANTGASPFMVQYLIGETSGWCRWSGIKTRKGSFVSASLMASGLPKSDAIEWTLRWDCKCLGSRPTELQIGFPFDVSQTVGDPTANGLEIKIDNQPVAFEWITLQQTSPNDRYRWAKLNVPEVAIDGNNRLDFLLQAVYVSRHPDLQKTEGQIELELSLPKLRSPLAGESATGQVVVEDAQLLVQSTASYDWVRPSESKRGSLDIDPMDLSIAVSLRKREFTPQSPLRLEGEWLQTIVNAIEQRDRYVARFQTDERTIRIPAPAGLLRATEWMIDGQRVTVREDTVSSGFATITLPETSEKLSASTYVLEAYTTQAAPKGWLRKVKPIGPRLQVSPSSAPMIWQIIVPRTEHLIGSTQNALPMYQWRWSDLFLRRVGQTSQEQIEDRFGATKQPILAQQVNQYDLTSFASAEPLEATFVPSALIWLPVSLIVLCLAAVLKDNRWIRWPWFWALFFAAFFIFSQIAWDISLLVLQAAIASVALALVYNLVRWLLDRRARRRSIFVSRQYSSAAVARINTGSHLSKRAVGDSSALRSTVTAKTKEPQ